MTYGNAIAQLDTVKCNHSANNLAFTNDVRQTSAIILQPMNDCMNLYNNAMVEDSTATYWKEIARLSCCGGHAEWIKKSHSTVSKLF
jgi:hypothetical protein